SDAAAIMVGSQARYWVSAGVAVAAFGALNGWTLMQGQIVRSISRDKLFPPFFEKENKRGMPTRGIILSSVLVSAVMVTNYTKGLVEQFQFMTLMATMTSVLPFLFV